MARKYTKRSRRDKRSRRSSRGKRLQRGGASASYTPAPYAVSEGAPYAQVIVPGSACQAATPSGHLAGYTPPGHGGLPGFAGGGKRRSGSSRRRKGSRRSGSSKRRGRRGTRRVRGGGWTSNLAAPVDGPNVLAPYVSTGCRGAHFQQGGAPGGVASPFYTAGNAGYGFSPSDWKGSDGTPAAIPVGYPAAGLNPACFKTAGGGKRSKRGSKRGDKRR